MEIADDLVSLSAILTIILIPLWWFSIIDISLFIVILPMALSAIFSLIRFILKVFLSKGLIVK